MKGLRMLGQAECVPQCECKSLVPKSNSSKSSPLTHHPQRHLHQEIQRKGALGRHRLLESDCVSA